MLLFNAVVLSVIVMLVLSVARVHVVISLFVASLVGGLVAGMGISGTMVAFQDGLAGGAKIALSYALLGAFAMSVAHSGLPRLLANWIIAKLRNADDSNSARVARSAKWGILGGVLVMGVMSQNLIPIHIAFIPLLVPPLIGVMNELKMDRRLVACAITFGIVTTYMFVPIGFGRIFLHDILYKNIEDAGLPVEGIVNPMAAMAIPAASMAVGCAIALLVSYRKPREYEQRETEFSSQDDKPIDMKKVWAALIALVACFVIQAVLTKMDSEADPLLVGALVGLCLMLAMRVVPWQQADDVFSGGMRMMSLIGLIMITAQGYAAVLKASGQIEPLVEQTSAMFNGSKALAAVIMLLVGLIITMGIGSSFSTLPIISAIYVPLCVTLGFSPMATVAIIGTAGALGDAGSPTSFHEAGAGFTVEVTWPRPRCVPGPDVSERHEYARPGARGFLPLGRFPELFQRECLRPGFHPRLAELFIVPRVVDQRAVTDDAPHVHPVGGRLPVQVLQVDQHDRAFSARQRPAQVLEAGGSDAVTHPEAACFEHMLVVDRPAHSRRRSMRTRQPNDGTVVRHEDLDRQTAPGQGGRQPVGSHPE